MLAEKERNRDGTSRFALQTQMHELCVRLPWEFLLRMVPKCVLAEKYHSREKLSRAQTAGATQARRRLVPHVATSEFRRLAGYEDVNPGAPGPSVCASILPCAELLVAGRKWVSVLIIEFFTGPLDDEVEDGDSDDTDDGGDGHSGEYYGAKDLAAGGAGAGGQEQGNDA